jgi:hypothetical protein
MLMHLVYQAGQTTAEIQWESFWIQASSGICFTISISKLSAVTLLGSPSVV